jgi:hydrogenase expression/formation protein HypC
VETDGRLATVEVLGNRRRVDVSLVDALPGEYVLLHAGIAIAVLDEAEAEQTLAAYRAALGDGLQAAAGDPGEGDAHA